MPFPKSSLHFPASFLHHSCLAKLSQNLTFEALWNDNSEIGRSITLPFWEVPSFKKLNVRYDSGINEFSGIEEFLALIPDKS